MQIEAAWREGDQLIRVSNILPVPLHFEQRPVPGGWQPLQGFLFGVRPVPPQKKHFPVPWHSSQSVVLYSFLAIALLRA